MAEQMNSKMYNQKTAVEMKHVTKCFSQVVANKDVSLHVSYGETLALLGENGAGKSTIMKILYGLYSLDEGEIFINGERVNIKSPLDAKKYGIAMVQQHFSLVMRHTATENIILGNTSGYIDIDKYNDEIRKLAGEYGFDVPVDVPVEELSVGQQQKVEILKALYINAKILILDEPTAVLTPQESDILMQFIKDYVSKGNSVIFITHKLKEVMQVADRVIVMRGGVVSGRKAKAEIVDENELAYLMIGKNIVPPNRNASLSFMNNKEMLVIENLQLVESGIKHIDNVSFSVHSGEIFGIAGVSGNGQDDLCDCICGARHQTAGNIYFDGECVNSRTIRERNSFGMGYVPLDRYRDAMVMSMTLDENILLKNCYDSKWYKHGFIIKKHELEDYTNSIIKNNAVKATGPSDLAKSLSGGNQQKVVLGREVEIGSKILVFNQPTRGLDMGAVDRIHHTIADEKERGKAILLVSTELSEIFEICDRICVMYKGGVMGIFKNGEVTPQQVGLMMAGVAKEKALGEGAL